MRDWEELFSSSNAAGTNVCLDLSCRSFPTSGDRSLSYRSCLAPERGELEIAWFLSGEAQLIGC